MKYRTARQKTRSHGSILVLAAALVAAACASASAEPCLVKVQRFAKSRDLSINPPNIAGDKMPDGLSSKKLGRSGGVIEPRPMNDPAVLHPKSDRDYRMPTTPDIAPETHMNQNSGARAVHPSDRALLESILVAARNAARRGYEQACLERLKTAQRLAEHQDR